MKLYDMTKVLMLIVAPHVGAWIETGDVVKGTILDTVAPHVGAWIETAKMGLKRRTEVMSRPTWARGLKHSLGLVSWF